MQDRGIALSEKPSSPARPFFHAGANLGPRVRVLPECLQRVWPQFEEGKTRTHREPCSFLDPGPRCRRSREVTTGVQRRGHRRLAISFAPQERTAVQKHHAAVKNEPPRCRRRMPSADPSTKGRSWYSSTPGAGSTTISRPSWIRKEPTVGQCNKTWSEAPETVNGRPSSPTGAGEMLASRTITSPDHHQGTIPASRDPKRCTVHRLNRSTCPRTG